MVRESATSLAVVVDPRSKLASLALSDAAALFLGEDRRATIIVLQPAESSAHWALLGSVLDISAAQMDRALLQRRYQDELNAEVRTVATSKDVGPSSPRSPARSDICGTRKWTTA